MMASASVHDASDAEATAGSIIRRGQNGTESIGGGHSAKTFDSAAAEVRDMLKFSFSNEINDDIDYLEKLISIIDTVRNLIFDESFMDETNSLIAKNRMDHILKQVASQVGHDFSKKPKTYGHKVDRRNERFLSIEAVTLFLFMKSNNDFELERDEFDQLYAKKPEFASVGSNELDKLFKYCNCVRVALKFIPPLNNKEHILDLVTRLEEGYAIKRVTGTGMTPDTRRRYLFIHSESGIEPQARNHGKDGPSEGRPLVANLFDEHQYHRRQETLPAAPVGENAAFLIPAKKGRGRPRKVRDSDTTDLLIGPDESNFDESGKECRFDFEVETFKDAPLNAQHSLGEIGEIPAAPVGNAIPKKVSDSTNPIIKKFKSDA